MELTNSWFTLKGHSKCDVERMVKKRSIKNMFTFVPINNGLHHELDTNFDSLNNQLKIFVINYVIW